MTRAKEKAKPGKAVSRETAPAVPEPEAEWRREQRVALWRLRQHLHLTQQQLAEQVGMSLRSVARYESGADVIPFRVVKKLMDLATGQPGLEADLRWWGLYLDITLREQTGLGPSSNLESYLAGRVIETAAVEQLRDFLVLWSVFHPQMTPADERIHSELSRRLNAIVEALMPEKEIRCHTCGQSDQTRRVRGFRSGVLDTVKWYICTRCQTAEKEQETVDPRERLKSSYYAPEKGNQ
jgi:transcriptional regulator with XRE-family HTH domain